MTDARFNSRSSSDSDKLSSVNRRSFLSASCGLTILSAASKPADAFALIGDRYHNSDYIRTALNRTVVREAGISVDFTDETRLLNEDTLRRYKLVIILRDGMIWPEGYPDERSNAAYLSVGAPKIISDPPMPEGKPQPAGWLSEAQGRAFRKWVEDGGAALLLHNTTYISRYNEDFRKVLGAITQNHPPIRPFKVKITNASHPITPRREGLHRHR